MFLRIEDRPEVPWRYCYNRPATYEQVPDAERDSKIPAMNLTPVTINPCLRQGNTYSTVQVGMNETGDPELRRRRQFATQNLKKHSIGKTFLSDPHRTKTEVDLHLTLGVRLPTQITVHSVVNSQTPLTIDELVRKALDQSGAIRIDWRGDGHMSFCDHFKPGVPRQRLDELKRQTGLEVFFRYSDFSFELYNSVSPTDEERLAVSLGEVGP
jgi:hypothetical protein